MRKGLVIVAGIVFCAACSSGPSPSSVGSSVLRWAASATAVNGPAGPIDVVSVCGSSTDTYLLELQHHAPTALKVVQEWGDVTPGGRQLLVSGTVATVYLVVRRMFS